MRRRRRELATTNTESLCRHDPSVRPERADNKRAKRPAAGKFRGCRENP
jgi:hypothetical protein